MNQTKVNEAISSDIIKFLKENRLWHDIALYFNNKRINSEEEVLENVDVSEVITYCNPETVTMSFGRPFEREMNGENGSYEVYEKFSKLLEKHGYYFELGYTWSLSLYKIDCA